MFRQCRTCRCQRQRHADILAATDAKGVGGAAFGGLLTLALLLLGLLFLSVAAVGFVHSKPSAPAELLAVAERDRLASRFAELSDALSRAAEGDLSVNLPVDDLGDEDAERLAMAFDRTLRRLQDLVSEAQSSGDRLARAAQDLRGTAVEQSS